MVSQARSGSLFTLWPDPWPFLPVAGLVCALALIAGEPSFAQSGPSDARAHVGSTRSDAFDRPGVEARLLRVLGLIREGRRQEALKEAEALVQGAPQFRLAQLVLGDLLWAQARPIHRWGSASMFGADAEQLHELRQEAAARLRAQQQRPPVGAKPRQFVMLSAWIRHAIAIDASMSRLYLFENGAQGLQLVADYYVSLGKLGIDKHVDGDQRTPLGIYFITGRLEKTQLRDFYGAGALTLNYPNMYDRRRGKSGHGIWLHGVPSDAFVRPPLATDGCIVLSNADLEQLLSTVTTGTTPVVVAPRLDWVYGAAVAPEEVAFQAARSVWQAAHAASGTPLQDLSVLAWHDGFAELRIVTLRNASDLESTSRPARKIKREYWIKEDGQWRIFFDGVVE